MVKKLNATIEGDTLVIRVRFKSEPHPSHSGRTLIVASSEGPRSTTAAIDGKPVGVKIVAWIPRHDPT